MAESEQRPRREEMPSNQSLRQDEEGCTESEREGGKGGQDYK